MPKAKTIHNQYAGSWTKDELEILKEFYPLHPKSEVLCRINRSWKAIEAKAERMGIKRPYNTRGLTTISLSPDLAYVLGALLGDGCSDRYEKRITLSVKDEEFADRFAKALRRMGIGVYRRFKDGFYHVVGNSLTFHKWLENLSLESLKGIVNSYPIDFLKGFFDAEGSFIVATKTRQLFCKIHNTREDLIELIKETIVRLGFQVRKEVRRYKLNRKDLYILSILGGKEEVRRFLQLIEPISRKRDVLRKATI